MESRLLRMMLTWPVAGLTTRSTERARACGSESESFSSARAGERGRYLLLSFLSPSVQKYDTFPPLSSLTP